MNGPREPYGPSRDEQAIQSHYCRAAGSTVYCPADACPHCEKGEGSDR